MYDQPPPPPTAAYYMEAAALDGQVENFSYSMPQANADSNYVPFSELRCNPDDIAKIEDIIISMGTRNKLSLLITHQKRLRKKGDELRRDVHPLKFLAYIHKNPRLKQYLADIMNDYFKRSNFTKDLFKQLNDEHKRGSTMLYAVEFAEDLGLPPNYISSLIAKKNWNDLVKALTK